MLCEGQIRVSQWDKENFCEAQLHNFNLVWKTLPDVKTTLEIVEQHIFADSISWIMNIYMKCFVTSSSALTHATPMKVATRKLISIVGMLGNRKGEQTYHTLQILKSIFLLAQQSPVFIQMWISITFESLDLFHNQYNVL